MTWYESAFGPHYGWLYAHRDETEAAACVDALAGIVSFAAGRVLDLGCGEGRHLDTLVAQTPRGVIGVDLSAPLLRAAKARTSAQTPTGLLRADMRALPLADSAFGTVVSLFTAFGYFGGLDAHGDLLIEIARVLEPEGAWCLDYLNCRRVRRDLSRETASNERVVGPCRVTETKRLDSGGTRILKRVQIDPLPGRQEEAAERGIPSAGLDYTEAVALFEPEALDALAARAGLVRRDALGGYDGRPFAPDTAERWILVYGKRP